MAIARFQMPDGRIARYEVPDGLSPEQAHAMVSQSMTPAPGAPDPTDGNSFIDNALAATGRGMTSVMRAVGVPSRTLSGWGLPGTAEEANRLDAPLMKTAGGKFGNALGTMALAAPAAFIPGANTYLGAAAIGAGTGAALTDGGLADRAKGALFGAAGGAAGKGMGDLLGYAIPRVVSSLQRSRTTAQLATAQRDAAATAARDAGYVLPPADVNPSMLNEALGGLSGKIKTAQVASQRNQGVTNNLAKQALGVADDAPLTIDALRAIRSDAGKAYEAVKGIGQVKADAQYTNALDALKSQYEGAAKDFPGLAKGEVSSLVDALKQPTFEASSAVDAIKVLRETADKAFRSGDSGLGKAAKSAAVEMESLLERNLQASGAPADLLQGFQQARKTIAKTYTVEKALNSETGDVSAQVLAAQLKRGKPLSGEIETIARAGLSFPKATQALKESPKSFSPLDFALSGGMSAATGNPALMATIVARPAARSMLLSNTYQGLLARPRGYSRGLLEEALPALQSEAFHRSLPVMGGLLSIDLAQK